MALIAMTLGEVFLSGVIILFCLVALMAVWSMIMIVYKEFSTRFLSTEKLYGRIQNPGRGAGFSAACDELTRRGEPIISALPQAIRMMLSDDRALRLEGFWALRSHFRDISEPVRTFDPKYPDEEHKAYLKEMLDDLIR